jgi:hypothetical protein
MDPDFNSYDLNHRVTHHPAMSDREWDEVFTEATRRFLPMNIWLASSIA